MADNRRYGLTPQLDIGQILLDAQNRWLRPTEVCEILRNYKRFCLTPEPPFKPAGGSLFLFDRKALRYFRKDGHNWRKKKDGKTVREAHERLKAGSVDVLHCYYAHGEDNEHFQRRSYWMLEEQYEHIVLVHYREVKESNRSALRSLNTERTLQSANVRGQVTSPDCSAQANSSALQSQTAYASSPSTAEWNGPNHSSECEEGESGDDVGASPPVEAESCSGDQASHVRLNQIEGLVADSRAQLPVSRSKVFTDLLVENQASHGVLDRHQTSSGQYPFLELQQPDPGLCFKQDGENQQNAHFSSHNLSSYSNGEASGLLYGPGWNDFISQNKNVQSIGSEYNPSRSFNLPTWTEMLKHSTAGLMNAAYDPKVTCMVSEEIRGQIGCKRETFVTDDLNGGESVFADGDLQHLARSDIQNIAMQINSQKSISTSPPWNKMQEQSAEWGHEPGVFQNTKCLSRDLQHSHEEAFQKNDQEKQHKIQNNCSSQLLTDEYAPSKAENDFNPGIGPVDFHVSKLSESPSQVEGQESLKKLDSFGRWMSKEIGGDGDESLVASDSGTYWSTLDNQNGVEEVSSLSHQMQLDIDLMGPSLSQEQLFSIVDFSPDWAYTEVDTKILITGTFLGGLKYLQKYKWSCMFGEVEVPAELLGQSVLRCHAPPHAPGRVPFYVTCSNRLACSEVRDFEYRAKRSGVVNAGMKMEKRSADIILLEIRFAKSLSLNLDKKDRYCTSNDCEKCSLKSRICSLTEDGEDEWEKMERSTEDSTLFLDKTREQLMQKLFKEKLYDWLLYQIHEEGKGPNVLDDQGQGAIHKAAALGYDWAISPIVAAGVGVNIRDTHGWSALHWAAFYGREETVVALVTLGASPGAVTDPKPKYPAGLTPADLASKRGHKGIAGYLAESHLTSHLSSLTFKENIMDSVSASLAGEKAVETVAENSIIPLDGGGENQLSLKDSLAAVRNSAQAAARIQSAFRVHSFRRKQFVAYGDAKCGMSDEEALTFVSVQKTNKLGHYDEALHTAALRIQRKFRGWKGRKEFLIIRNRIVKIQAHIRGHQVRKQYKKVVWSVGIVEKAILRWRRKRVGLRGFRAEAPIVDSGTQGQSDEYDFLRAGRKQTVAGIEKALARVQSMVRYPEARDQYRRLVTNFQKIKVGIEQITDGDSQQEKENKTKEDDELMSMTD